MFKTSHNYPILEFYLQVSFIQESHSYLRLTVSVFSHQSQPADGGPDPGLSEPASLVAVSRVRDNTLSSPRPASHPQTSDTGTLRRPMRRHRGDTSDQ